MSNVQPRPAYQRVRKGDPRTSVEAARRATKASMKALQAVESVMSDGQARIDEEIWAACRLNGYISTLDTVQHAREALSMAGVLMDSGTTRLTSNGCASIAWVANPLWEDQDVPMPMEKSDYIQQAIVVQTPKLDLICIQVPAGLGAEACEALGIPASRITFQQRDE